MGVNTTDVEVYGESYAGYIWVQVEHLSLFAVAGQVYQVSLFEGWMTIVAVFVLGITGVVVVFAFKRYRRTAREGKQRQMIDSLMD